MGYKHKILAPDPILRALDEPNFLIKIIPHVDGTLRVCELVRYHLQDVDLKGAWSGPAALEAVPSRHGRRREAACARSARRRRISSPTDARPRRGRVRLSRPRGGYARPPSPWRSRRPRFERDATTPAAATANRRHLGDRAPITTGSRSSCRAAARSAPIRPASYQALAEASMRAELDLRRLDRRDQFRDHRRQSAGKAALKRSKRSGTRFRAGRSGATRREGDYFRDLRNQTSAVDDA